jgi:uncharacterized protein (TIGR03435 family)
MQSPQTFRKALLLAIEGIVAVAVVNAPRAQTPDTKSPAFEVASVKLNKSSNGPKGIRPVGPGGRFSATRLTLRELTRLAYGSPAALMADQVIGGSSWIDSDYFDVVAKVAEQDLTPNANTALGVETLMMLRSLLGDRFRLKMHTESRQLPIYALVSSSRRRSSPQLRLSTGDCVSPLAAPRSVTVDRNRLCGFTTVGAGLLAGRGVTMEFLAGVLSQFPDVGRIVRDRTGLSGAFDIDLKYSPAFPAAANPDASVANPTSDSGPSVFTAIQEQLGLKLESTKAPVDVLVIDHVEQPTPD